MTLPYQMMLQKSVRKAMNIDIKDSIVIFDEAHNLVESIQTMNAHSVSRAMVGLLGWKIGFSMSQSIVLLF